MKMFVIMLCFMVFRVVANQRNNFVVDYFIYKKVTNVFLLNCNIEEDNLLLIKKLSYVGITISLAKLNENLSIYSLAKTKYYRVGVLINGPCHRNSNLSSALSEAGYNRMYDELHSWLVITTEYDNLFDFTTENYFDLSTDFVVAIENDGYEMYDVYNPSKSRGFKLNVTLLGTWSKEDGLNILLTQSKYTRRANLHGMIWRVAYLTSKYKPTSVLLENHLKDFEKTGTKDNLAKFGYSVVSHLAEMHNATMLLRQYGSWKKGDNVGPLSRALLYGEIDITGTVISVTSEKMRLVKFVYSVWPFRTCFMFRSPQPKVIKMHQIFGQFDSLVWRTSSIVALFSFLGLAVTFHFKNTDCGTRYSDSYLIVVACICQQYTQLDLNNVSTRVAFLSTMLFSMVMYNYYSASVVSTRLSDNIVKMPDSLVSLAKSKMRVASEPMIYFDFLMKDHGKDADYFNKTKWQNIEDTEKFMLPEKGMQLAKSGGFAYHTHPDVGYPYVDRLYDNRETCELTEVHLGRLSYRSIAVAYNSSLAEISRVGFARMSEVGIRHRQLIRWTSRKPRCRSDILSAASITIYEFAPQLIILSVGLWLAMTVCVAEIVVDKYNMRTIAAATVVTTDVFVKEFFKVF